MKYLLRTSTLGATLALSAALSWAQTASPASPAPSTLPQDGEEKTVELEAVTVTGSNIRRIDEERTLPVTVLDADDIAAFAAPTPAELLAMLPGGGVITLDEGNTLGADARGDNMSLNLRGIGSGNTLVMLNGRRLAPHPISQSEGGVPSLAVNVNVLPGAAIQRVEVLREGASAIYGADAAAGVVNTIVRKDYQGSQIKVSGSVTEHGGGNDWRVTAASGGFFNAGRTHLTTVLDFYHRDFLGTADRFFSSDADLRRTHDLPLPWSMPPVGTDVDFDNRSEITNWGTFRRGEFDANGNFVGSRPDRLSPTSTLYRGITTTNTTETMTTSTSGQFFITPIAEGVVGFKNTAPLHGNVFQTDYHYNQNAHRTILPRTDRINFLSQLDHEISDRLAAFGELLYYRADSFTQREPTGIEAAVDSNIYVGIDNPWNPFGTRFYHPTGLPNPDGSLRVTGTPAPLLIEGLRPREFRPRQISVLSQSIRGVVGLRGKGFGDFEWESGLMYSQAWTRDKEEFAVRHSRLQDALLRTDETAFNPFGYTFKLVNVGGSNPLRLQLDQPYTNPDSVVNELYDTFERRGRTELATWDAKMSGTLFDLWLGNRVAAAFGLEGRWETYSDWRPPFHGQNPDDFVINSPSYQPGDNDFIALSPNINLETERNVMSGFGELLFPLVNRRNRIPLVQALEFSVAARYERFSDFGDTLKPKYALAWRPHSNVLFRASFNESFRAPNLVQNNPSPLQRAVTTDSDAYRYSVTSSEADATRNRTVFRQGNDALVPEQSRIATLGVALEVPKIKGLTITVDWWRLDQRDVIDNLTASGQMRRDAQLLDAASLIAQQSGANVTNINAQEGTADYIGNPKVLRAPVTDADRARFATWNTNNPTNQKIPVGRIISVVDDYMNLSGRDLEGFDMAVQYRTPRFGIGQFTLRGSASYRSKFVEKVDEVSQPDSKAAEDGRAKLRGNARLTWRRGKWSAAWSAEYFGGFMDTGAALSTGATGAAMYEALGRPSYIKVFQDIGGVVRYRWWVEETIQHNAYVEHRFGRQKDIHNNVTVRLGVRNIFDTAPALADAGRGYQAGAISPKLRTFYVDLTKRF